MPRTTLIGRTQLRGIAAVVALLLVGLTVTVTAISGGAAGQEVNNSSQAPERGVQIDENHRIVSSTYQNGTARLVFESDRPEAVTLVDQYAEEARSGGVIPTRTVYLDGRTVVEMPATKWKGHVSVSISTDNVLYSESIVDEQPESVQDSLSGASSTQAWVGGAGIAAFYFLIAGYLELRSEGTAPEVAS